MKKFIYLFFISYSLVNIKVMAKDMKILATEAHHKNEKMDMPKTKEELYKFIGEL